MRSLDPSTLLVVVLLVLSAIVPAGIATGTAQTSGRASTLPFIIQFNEDGGSNGNLKITVPVPSIVTKAQLSFDATNHSYVPSTKNYDYTQDRSHDAFKGNMSTSSPTLSPSKYNMKNPSASEITNLTTSNTKYMEAIFDISGPANNYVYEHFVFDIADSKNYLDSVKLTWEGYGILPKLLGDNCGVKIYVYNLNNNTWMYLTGYSESCADATKQDKTLSQVHQMDFKNTYGQTLPFIDIMVVSIFNGPEYQVNHPVRVATDLIKLDVTSHTETPPHNVGVNVGTVSPIEHLYPGSVKGTYTFGDKEGFKVALQNIINNSVDLGMDNLDVPLVFNSSSGGVITVKSILIETDKPPVSTKTIPTQYVNEDTPVKGLVDLLDHFDDDNKSLPLTYSVAAFSEKTHLTVEVTEGHFLSVTWLYPNWSGSSEVKISATDKWGRSVNSTIFTITVNRINDPPVIDKIPFLTAFEDSPFSYNVSASDIDGDTLSFEDDTPLFVINSKMGSIAFTPLQDQIGKYPFNISVTDNNGSKVKVASLIEVKGTNDRPTVSLLLPTKGFEVKTQSVQLAWVGKDVDQDELKYDLFIDSGDGMVMKAPDLTESQYQLDGLITGKTYKWSVEAKDAVSRSARPAPFEFSVKIDTGGGGGGGGNNNTTVNQPPTATLLSPARGTSIRTLSPTLTWKGFDAEGDTLTFNVVVYSSENVEFERYTTNTTYLSVPTSLENNKLYLWTVIPNDGTVDGTCLSGIWSFTTNRTSSVEPTPPHIGIEVDPRKAIDEGGYVVFDASKSSDPDGTINLYIWSFGDGTTLTGPQYLKVNHTFQKGGLYNVSLVIFDNDGKSDIWNYQQTVTSKTVPPKPKPALKFFGLDQTQLLILLAVIVVLVAVGTAGFFIAHRKLKYERYKVDQVFLVFQDGRLIKQLSGHADKSMDDGGEVLGGMLSAVQDFVKDSLKDSQGKSALRVLEYGEQKIVIERGSTTFLAVFISGNVTEKLRGRMKRLINDIETVNKDQLASWDGEAAALKNVDALDGLLKKA